MSKKENQEQRIAVIGAGLAGMRCAALLAEAGFQVSVFDKSRGTGGRLSSSRLGELTTDLGVPFIDTQLDELRQWLYAHQQHTQRWLPNQTDFAFSAAPNVATRELWVGVPRSSGLTRILASGITLYPETRVSVVWPDQQGVLLRDEHADTLGHFDKVVIATPAPQAAPLLDVIQSYQARAAAINMLPAWVVALELAEKPASLYDIDLLEGEHSEFARVLCESSKPQRQGEIWTLQATSDWSQAYLNLSADTVMHEMVASLVALTGDPIQVKNYRSHRWLYCEAQNPEAVGALWDADKSIGVCGEWLAEGGVDGAWKSGTQLAQMIMSS